MLRGKLSVWTHTQFSELCGLWPCQVEWGLQDPWTENQAQRWGRRGRPRMDTALLPTKFIFCFKGRWSHSPGFSRHSPSCAHGPSINVNNIPFYHESVPVKIIKNTIILLKGAMLVSSTLKMYRIPIQDSGVHSCPPHLTMSRKSGCWFCPLFTRMPSHGWVLGLLAVLS